MLAVGQMYRHDKANSGFSLYCEHAYNSIQDIFDLQFHTQ